MRMQCVRINKNISYDVFYRLFTHTQRAQIPPSFRGQKTTSRLDHVLCASIRMFKASWYLIFVLFNLCVENIHMYIFIFDFIILFISHLACIGVRAAVCEKTPLASGWQGNEE